MEENKKYQLIFDKNMAEELQQAEFELVEKRPNKKDETKDVYVFEQNEVFNAEFERLKEKYRNKKLLSRLNTKELDFILDKLTGQETKQDVDVNKIVQKLIGFKTKENKKNA